MEHSDFSGIARTRVKLTCGLSPMKSSTRLTMVAVAIVSGFSITVVTASNGATKQNAPASTSTLDNRVSLTRKQETATWQNIIKRAAKEKAPARFAAKVGVVVPSTLMTYPVPMTTSNKVPALRRYRYALLENNRLLIVNPFDRQVADVIIH